MQGYIIEYEPGLMYIIIGGLLCTLPTIMMNTCFKLNDYDAPSVDIDENMQQITSPQQQQHQQHHQQVIDAAVPGDYFLLKWSWLKANKQCTLILISTFVVALSSGSSDVIVNPVLMHIYGLSASEAGYASLSMRLLQV